MGRSGCCFPIGQELIRLSSGGIEAETLERVLASHRSTLVAAMTSEVTGPRRSMSKRGVQMAGSLQLFLGVLCLGLCHGCASQPAESPVEGSGVSVSQLSRDIFVDRFQLRNEPLSQSLRRVEKAIALSDFSVRVEDSASFGGPLSQLSAPLTLIDIDVISIVGILSQYYGSSLFFNDGEFLFAGSGGPVIRIYRDNNALRSALGAAENDSLPAVAARLLEVLKSNGSSMDLVKVRTSGDSFVATAESEAILEVELLLARYWRAELINLEPDRAPIGVSPQESTIALPPTQTNNPTN